MSTPERRTSEDRRAAARDARQRWAHEVLQALNEQRLTIHGAARQAGISPGALQAWLAQDVEPSPRAMEALALVIGRSHLHLVQLLGWLPRELAHSALRLEISDRLQEALAEAQRWVEASSSAARLGGGSLIADVVLGASDEWTATLEPEWRGRRHRTRYATRVSFNRAVSTAEPVGRTKPARTAADRREIQELLSRVQPGIWHRSGAGWQSIHPQVSDLYTRPDLVLSVPFLAAVRARGLRPRLALPPSIMVIGAHPIVTRDVGALLSSALDWAYLDTTAIARERFDVAPRTPAAIVAEIEIAHRLLQTPAEAGRFTVWSYSQMKHVGRLMQILHDELPLVIFLEIPDEGKRQSRPTAGTVEDIRAAQGEIRRALQRRRPESHLILRLSPLDLIKSSDPHESFDRSVDLAFEAAHWLQRHHVGPPLDEASGILGDLWRRRHSRP